MGVLGSEIALETTDIDDVTRWHSMRMACTHREGAWSTMVAHGKNHGGT